MKRIISEEVLKMQKRAGLITEGEYKQALNSLNEAGMNLPWLAKEPESWGKPDKESKFFVHGDYETAKSKGETPIEFIGIEDNRPDYDSVFVLTNMPSQLRKNKDLNPGKDIIAAKLDKNGDPTGHYWFPAQDSSESDSMVRKVKDWSPLEAYIKSELSKNKDQK